MSDDEGRAPSEARERVIRQVCARIAAEAALRETPAPRESAVVVRKIMPPPTQVGATLRSPPVGLVVAG